MTYLLYELMDKRAGENVTITHSVIVRTFVLEQNRLNHC
jgi:hypothetical protein